MSKHTSKVGLIGLGYWGKNLCRNFHAIGYLAIACDTCPETTVKFQDMYPELAFTNTPADILTDPNITAVVIATPAAIHYDMALAALENGKDVFVEKTLAINLDRAKALFDDIAEEKLNLYPHKIHWTNGKIPSVEKAEKVALPYANEKPLRNECQHFIQCIQTRTQPRTDGEEGLAVLSVLDAAERTIKQAVKLS